jgi:hypothetical protein
MNIKFSKEIELDGRTYNIKATPHCAFVSILGNSGHDMNRWCNYSSIPLNKTDDLESVIAKLSFEIAVINRSKRTEYSQLSELMLNAE